MRATALSGAAIALSAAALASAGSPLDSATHALCFSECRLSERGHMNATLMGGAQCRNGEGLDLTGGFASLEAVELGGTMTMALWLKLAPPYAGKPSYLATTILGFYSGQAGAYTNRIDLWTSDAGVVTVSFEGVGFDETETQTVESIGEAIVPHSWVHVAWTVDDSQLVQYQDGARVASADAPFLPILTTRETHALGDNIHGTWSVGGIFSLHIWQGRTLNQSEIMKSARDDACKPANLPSRISAAPTMPPAPGPSAHSRSSTSDRGIPFFVAEMVLAALLLLLFFVAVKTLGCNPREPT